MPHYAPHELTVHLTNPFLSQRERRKAVKSYERHQAYPEAPVTYIQQCLREKKTLHQGW